MTELEVAHAQVAALILLLSENGVPIETTLETLRDAKRVVFVDGDPEGCVCGPECEMPCWQRVGLTDRPCCKGCVPLGAV